MSERGKQKNIEIVILFIYFQKYFPFDLITQLIEKE